MQNESCARKYSHYFNDEVKKIFREYHVPIPYILEILEEFCEDTSCKHHFFSIRFGFESRGEKHNQNAPLAQSCHGCACLIGLLSDSASHEAIGAVYGVKKQTIEWTEKQAFKKFRRKSHAYNELSQEEW